MLFKDKQFKNVSAEAKVLYGLMLDRMGLSQKNMWLDEIVEIMVDVICSREPYIRINKQDYPYEMVKDSVSVLNCMKVQLLGY